MKSSLSSALRILGVSAAVSLLTLTVTARTPGTDRAAEFLASHGSVALSGFGDYVEVGTYAIQVTVKMGKPDGRLTDGTWLYHHRRIAGSDAEGTVVVQFDRGRVSALLLATPATVARLRAAPSQAMTERLAHR